MLCWLTFSFTLLSCTFTVTPNVTSSLFDIDVSTGVITLLRPVVSTDVESRQFLIQIIASDSHEQTVSFFSSRKTSIFCRNYSTTFTILFRIKLNDILNRFWICIHIVENIGLLRLITYVHCTWYFLNIHTVNKKDINSYVVPFGNRGF